MTLVSDLSKYLAIAAFILGSLSGIGFLFLYTTVSTQKNHGYEVTSYEHQGDVGSQFRYRSVADGPYQAPSHLAAKDAQLSIESVWWNNELVPNLCYQVENTGVTASSHYSIEIYRGSLEKTDLMLRTSLRSPLEAGQNIFACMSVPASVQRERELILLVAKQVQ